jgi:hypothetical protein
MTFSSVYTIGPRILQRKRSDGIYILSIRRLGERRLNSRILEFSAETRILPELRTFVGTFNAAYELAYSAQPILITGGAVRHGVVSIGSAMNSIMKNKMETNQNKRPRRKRISQGNCEKFEPYLQICRNCDWWEGTNRTRGFAHCILDYSLRMPSGWCGHWQMKERR